MSRVFGIRAVEGTMADNDEHRHGCAHGANDCADTSNSQSLPDELDSAGRSSDPTAFPVKGLTSASVNPAPSGPSAIPAPMPAPVKPAPKKRGRPPIDRSAASNPTQVQTIRAARIQDVEKCADKKRIPTADRLFSSRPINSAVDDAAFVQAVAGQVLASFSKGKLVTAPLSLADAVNADGIINYPASVALLGRWLVLEGAPGLQLRPGKPIDRRQTLILVAAVSAALVGKDRWRAENHLSAEAEEPRMSDADIAKAIRDVFGQKIKPGAVNCLRLSVSHALRNFLAYRRGARPRFNSSPLLARVLAATDSEAKLKTVTPSSNRQSTAPVARGLIPGKRFVADTRYSDAVQAAIYAPDAGTATGTGPSITYLATTKSKSATSSQVYQPDVDFGGIRIEAVVDRMELGIELDRWQPHRQIKAIVDKAISRRRRWMR